eukprot:Gb_17848 [translate_table: standard]
MGNSCSSVPSQYFAIFQPEKRGENVEEVLNCNPEHKYEGPDCLEKAHHCPFVFGGPVDGACCGFGLGLSDFSGRI